MRDSAMLQAGQKMDRRTLLRGAGAALALPLLEAMLPRSVRAAVARSGGTAVGGAPRRLAFLFVPNGIHMPAWTPATEGAGFALRRSWSRSPHSRIPCSC